MKTISILGSTGSIGLNSLEIIKKKKNYFKIILLSAKKNIHLIEKQIKIYKPKYFIIDDNETYSKIKKKFKNNKTKIYNSFENIIFKSKIDVSITAIPGIQGLKPTLKMVKSSKKLLIANKEAIICGWKLINKYSRKYKTKIIPIDSEHFSIFKLIDDQNKKNIKKIYLTASGGPFLNYNLKKLKKITPKDALKHPKWKMGKKITVDSSTLMNKMLEIIEAQKLFNLPENKVDMIIHPESLVHAVVEFKNGLTKFIYHDTSMIIPLANAILEDSIDIKDFIKNKKNINALSNLNFKRVPSNIFPIIKFKKRLNEHPSTSIIVNAANEVLVDRFLRKKIDFLSINRTVIAVLKDRNYKKYAIKRPISLKIINTIDNWARNKTLSLITKKK